ncbi:caspase family protein [Actinoplanes sp. NPDC051475]|uniref:caspase family protein n=1 Tax=Actinoplanes sp. NPDC051475 TaxID=3157225 RepID=UPI00344B9F7E
MPRSIALLIGVSRVRGLPVLTGVASGLDQFAEWAERQDFAVQRFDDLGGDPLEIKPVTAAVREAVDAGDVERLFVYFSGHGVIRGLDEEYWLLSEVADQDTEAVNVVKSAMMAYHCGIAHVALFADACRTPASNDLVHVSGTSLFPRRAIAADVEVDQFFATQFGDPAYEVVEDAEGLFTRYLIRGLNGRDPDAVRTVLPPPERPAILSNTLKPVLARNVEFAAAKLRRVQRPSCRPGSYWDPNRHVLAWVTAPPAADGVLVGGPAGDLDLRLRGVPSSDSAHKRLAGITRRYATAIGDGPAAPAVGGLLTLVRGDRKATVVLPRFPGHRTVVVPAERGAPGAELIAVLPVEPLTGGPPAATPEVIGSVAARLMTNTLDLDTLGDRVHAALWTELNPTLAVLLGGELARHGRRKDVRRLVAKFVERQRSIPYDLTLFAELDERLPDVRPSFPLLTSSWSLLDDPAPLARLRRSLSAAVWTTFRIPPPELFSLTDREDR